MQALRGRVGCGLLAVLLSLSGCATPTERFEHAASEAGFSRQIVQAGRFDHLVLTNGIPAAPGRRLHVYIEGDGSAWIANRWIAKDPTPRNPVALALMRIDPSPSIYLGRPCYFELQRNCTPELWTTARYSETVLQAMSEALSSIIERTEAGDGIVLIGYSGGGALAMLLAPRVAGVEDVVTVAANLDVNGWIEHHGYSALVGSLDPAREPPLPPHIRQIHLAGGSDRNVPLASVEHAAARQPDADVIVYPRFTHECCWKEVWREILANLERG